MPERRPITEVALVFLRLGLTAFGGPAAHVAMMEEELVRRRRWLTHERFLDLLGVANLIPGPSSTELAIYLGYERAGWLGLLLGGTCFISPAAVMVCAIAFAYARYGTLPALAGVLYGVKPIVLAVVAQAIWGLAPKAVKKSWLLGGVGAGAIAASAFGLDALVVLLGSGLVVAFARFARPPESAALLLVPAGAKPFALTTLGATFLKIGALVFGSGYVLLVFLRADFVERLHWLTEAQLLDAVAVGQVTPGPVFTTATFVGFLVGGVRGAVVATIAIFLPGFLLVALTRPLIAKLRASPRASAFLDGVTVASVALMIVVGVQLARGAIIDVLSATMTIIAAIVLVRWKPNVTWLVAIGAAIGFVHARL